jgi:hypothetical protein
MQQPTPVERHFDTHPELERKSSRKLRKNYKLTVLPSGTARGVQFGREAFRGRGAPLKPAHGKRVKSFVRGDRIFTSDEAVWLRAGHADQHVVSGTDGQVAYNRDLIKLTGAQLRELASAGNADAQREIDRRAANRKAKKGGR